ncbi:exodeoxyribonuclease VII small subunit [Curtanaerobium respiraculi]|uniref:exodeoxyribonuclease VII small subunit n=1 Tax=Curtanaerobium respiraculi TaxID=2949669 RepID=UPI0024B38383|nr:exodeoxyribonuclease VII small subunit [Curtanaerobium respiraculi]
MESQEKPTFEHINERLREIGRQVEDEGMPLDDALDLFEEAVQLGMQASSLLEEGIAARDAAEDETAQMGDAPARTAEESI